MKVPYKWIFVSIEVFLEGIKYKMEGAKYKCKDFANDPQQSQWPNSRYGILVLVDSVNDNIRDLTFPTLYRTITGCIYVPAKNVNDIAAILWVSSRNKLIIVLTCIWTHSFD